MTTIKDTPASISSIAPTSRYLRCCDREVHYVEWGDPGAPPVLMWHGLARTGRDFDELAIALAPTYHVICPDMIGRGLSQWSPLPDAEYCFGFYSQVAQALVLFGSRRHHNWGWARACGAVILFKAWI